MLFLRVEFYGRRVGLYVGVDKGVGEDAWGGLGGGTLIIVVKGVSMREKVSLGRSIGGFYRGVGQDTWIV